MTLPFMAAMAVGSLIQSNSQRNAQMKAKAADARLQRAKLERARLRATEDYEANTQRAREAAQRREIQIESNRIDAESNIDVTFAGSGIGGQSVDDLDAELNASVMANKYENKKQLDIQLSDMAKNYSNTMSDSAEQAAGIDTTAVKGSFLGDAMGAVSAAASGAQSGAIISKALGFGAKKGG